MDKTRGKARSRPFPAATLVGALMLAILFVMTGSACDLGARPPLRHPVMDRESRLPPDIVKQSPATDRHPPQLHVDEYHPPVPLPYPVNTRGAEDSPFILPDGRTLYFFFTPDVRVPPQEQVLDGVTGIYVTRRSNGGWSEPQRVWLTEPGRLALDGAPFVQDDEMWFCSAREGYHGVNLFTARRIQGEWRDWQYVGDHLMHQLQVGEMHLHGDDLYFHSHRPGGQGQLDIWMTTRQGDSWSEAVKLGAVNSPAHEGWPWVSQDGQELWFTRTHQGTPAIFRSRWTGADWGSPQLIVSQFAAEPTLDDAGNLYFCHHYFRDGEMIEADIYVAYRR